jgi:DNA-directed RNA polymerase specialized sigma24 family protein
VGSGLRRGREKPLDGIDLPAPVPEPVTDSALLAALRRLPRQQREVITLRVLLDLRLARGRAGRS